MTEKEAKPGRCADPRLKTNVIRCCDAQASLKKLPDACIDCVVTSPPFWSLRDYGVLPNKWADGTRSALGLEPHFDSYIEHLCEVFDELSRVLKPTGTLWVNLGDTYHNATKWTCKDESPQTISGQNNRGFKTGRRMNQGLPEKCLSLIPQRFVLSMVQRGWILRNDIVWHKPNHMPTSVKDRFACSWEHLFLFAKRSRYYFDLDAVRIPHSSTPKALAKANRRVRRRPSPHLHGCRRCPNPGELQSAHPLGKNPGDYWLSPTEVHSSDSPASGTKTGQESNVGHPSDVWPIITRPSTSGHFATYPEALVERPIRAGCPTKVCKRCGTPKLTRRVFRRAQPATDSHAQRNPCLASTGGTNQIIFVCKCKRGFQPGIVLDPFMGTGTTAVVARRLGRRFIGFELNPRYVRMARKRLADAAHDSSSAAGAKIKKTA
ncbi:MAG TPA: site-specific DNA-methyltransferase [Rhodospirillales bacterium]|nr:site-specific DNA-methyltransferase [Rhodospirillales bacterium]